MAYEEVTSAFVVVRARGETFVVDLPRGTAFTVGGRGASLALDEGVAVHFTLSWTKGAVRFLPGDGDVHINGRRAAEAATLMPGDDIACADAQLVIGVSVPLTAKRRTLTHREFRERLYEELARAARAGRTTALVALHAEGAGHAITQRALSSFRAGDLIATYAPDEPEILLPGAGREEAEAVVERLLAAAGKDATYGIAIAPHDGDHAERLIRAVRSALRSAQRNRKRASVPPPRLEELKAEIHDRATRVLIDELGEAAPSPRPIMLTGELSCGKSIFARHVHEMSGRTGPFVTVRCATLDRGFDEWFSDTGEAARANGGTLFFDEVADLCVPAQRAAAMYLSTKVDVRVLASTQRALKGLLERGAFDESLYAHIDGARYEIPALRNRPEDILPLARSFAAEAGDADPKITPGAIARMRSYPWPGNVLELRNAMERAVRLSRGGEILAEHLPSEPVPIVASQGRLREHVDSVERDAIIKSLADSNHNQTQAAKKLGISRRALIYKMEKYGLKPPPRTTRRKSR